MYMQVKVKENGERMVKLASCDPSSEGISKFKTNFFVNGV